MNNDKALMVAPSLDNALATIEENQLIRLAELAMRSVMVGAGNTRRAINKQEAASLALISMATGASFVNGELFLTDTGPMFGVPLYERKADEYMWALLPGSSYHVFERPAKPGIDAIFNPDKGDVAQVVTITRDDWDQAWDKRYREFFLMLTDKGAPWDKAHELALQMAGPKPRFEFVGVVDGRESFSGDEYVNNQKTGGKKPEMFDRIERAKKRARKGALKHAFPRLNIPEPLEIISQPRAAELLDVTVRRTSDSPAPLPIASRVISDPDGNLEGELMAGLGYATEKPKTAPSDPNPYVPQETPEVPAMTYEIAATVQDSKGKLYAEMTDEELSTKVNFIRQAIEKAGEDFEKRSDLQYKLSAVNAIQFKRGGQA